jgi:hypothetical protein
MDTHSLDEPKNLQKVTGDGMPPPPDKITLAWLWNYMPFHWWLALWGALVAAFVFGVTIGNTTFIRELLNRQAAATRITGGADLTILDPLPYRLLSLIASYQKERGFDRVYIDPSGYTQTPGVPNDPQINFRTKLYRTDKTTYELNTQFYRLFDEIPDCYLKRYTVQGRWGFLVSVTKQGEQYLTEHRQ